MDFLHEVGDVVLLAERDLVDEVGVQDIHAGIDHIRLLGFLPQGSHEAVLTCLYHAVGDADALHGGDDGDVVVIATVVVVHVAVVLVDDDVAVAHEEGSVDATLEEAHAADGAQGLVFLGDVVVVGQVVDVVLDEVVLVVHREVELAAAYAHELVHNLLEDGLLAYGHEGLGDDVGNGAQTCSQTSRHDDHGEIYLLACWLLLLLGDVLPEHHVHEASVLAHHGHALRTETLHLALDALLRFTDRGIYLVGIEDALHGVGDGIALDDGTLDVPDCQQAQEPLPVHHEEILHMRLVHLRHRRQKRRRRKNRSVLYFI